jgi:hypothetical protein
VFYQENKMKNSKERALAVAVKILYFDDASDYETALWEIVELLGGQEAVDMLENHESLAYETYCQEDY